MTPEIRELLSEVVTVLNDPSGYQPRYLEDIQDRARAALSAAPQQGAPAVARLMYWNGKGGNLDPTSPIARTYTEMPQGQAPYWDEGEPLYLTRYGTQARICGANGEPIAEFVFDECTMENGETYRLSFDEETGTVRPELLAAAMEFMDEYDDDLKALAAIERAERERGD